MKCLSDYIQEEQKEVFKKYGVFFAFSGEQFEEGCKSVGANKKNKVREMGNGGYCLSKNFESCINELNEIHAKGVRRDIEENGIKEIIMRELGNYETQITGRWREAYEVLEDYEGVTEELVLKIYREDFIPLCDKNDWY